MSTENKTSQPSIDDILASIREIIAEEEREPSGANAGSAGEKAASRAGLARQVERDLARALRTHGAEAPNPEMQADAPSAEGAAEEVFDLSEEFIVSEAAAAVRREFAARPPLAEAGEEEPSQGAPASMEPFAGQEYAGHAETPTDQRATHQEAEAGAEAMTEESVSRQESRERWEGGYQMPIPDSGPAVPFGRERHGAETESTGAADEQGDSQFDLTDTYNRARAAEPARVADSFGRDRWTPREFGDSAIEELQERTRSDEEHREDILPEREQHEGGIEETSGETGHPAEQFAEEAEPSSEDQAREQERMLGLMVGADRSQPAEEAPSGGTDIAHAQAQEAAAVAEEAVAGARSPSSMGAPFVPWADRPAREEAAQPATEQEEALMSSHMQDAPEEQAAAETQTRQPESDGEAESETPAEPEPRKADQPEAEAASASGRTLEDSVKELLRPMLAKWLDENMPNLIKETIREEISKAGATSGSPKANRNSSADER